MKIEDRNNPSFQHTLDIFGLNFMDVEDMHLDKVKDGLYQLHIRLVPDYPPCPKCGHEHPHILNYVRKVISNGTIPGVDMDIVFHRRRYKCPNCHRTYSENNPFAFKERRISVAVSMAVLNDLKNVNETYTSVARRYGISPTTVANIFDEHIRVPEHRKLPEVLLIDEVYAFDDENGGYACVLLDAKTMIPVDILPNRKKEQLIKFFKSYTREERSHTLLFCSDMYQPYHDVVRKMFPQARRAVDRFHVLQEFGRKMKYVRTRIMKGTHHNSHEYYLLKHQHELLNLSPEAVDRKSGELLLSPTYARKYNHHFRRGMNRRELLDKLLAVSPDLQEVYDLNNELHALFRMTLRKDGEAKIRKKLLSLIVRLGESSLEEMQDFACTLERWKDEIMNSYLIYDRDFFVSGKTGRVTLNYHHLNSGMIENRNKVIQTMKRQANGFGNWPRFRNRVLYVMDPNVVPNLSIEIPSWKRQMGSSKDEDPWK